MPLLLMLLLATMLINCSKNESSNCRIVAHSLVFSQICKYARDHVSDSVSQYGRIETYNDFDFLELKPISTSKATGHGVTVYYDRQNRIVKIFCESSLPLNDYEYRVIHNPELGYKIIYPEEYHSDFESEFVDGFFIQYGNFCYFISFTKPVCVMRVDRNLRAINSLIFENDKLVYRTRINYKDIIHLYSESFFKVNKVFSLNNNTSLEQVVEYFDKEGGFIFEREKVIGVLKEFDYLPLWRFGGHHEYDILSKPL